MQTTVHSIDAVIRGRGFDTTRKFLPDGLTLIGGFDFLARDEQRVVSQIQGRSYANMSGMFDRFAGAKLKHQELFRRLDGMMAACMPAGYRFAPEANVVAALVLGRSAWSVLALTCLMELFTQAHYRQSIEPGAAIDPLWKDVFLFHWKEEAQHAILDEREWRQEDASLTNAARDKAVGDLIVLLGTVDGILQAQSRQDAAYFASTCGRKLQDGEQGRVEAGFLHAYRWQYILSGVQVPHFSAILGGMLDPAQHGRIAAAIAPLYDGEPLPRELAAA